jgi:agmatine/peptidylarginine deiminase
MFLIMSDVTVTVTLRVAWIQRPGSLEHDETDGHIGALAHWQI